MSLKKNVLFLGLGNCGCKQAKVFYEMGYKAMFANGSEQDLKILGNVPNIYRLRGFDGFGGHRERALNCLANNPEFVEALQGVKEKIVFVLHSTAGSTGSGIAPYCEEVLTEATDEEGNQEKIVCPVPTLPSFDEPIGKKKSAYKAMLDIQEMRDVLGATFFINNNAVKDYDRINGNFAKILDNYLTNDSYGKLNNFDESEKIEMLRQSGATVLGLFGKEHDKAFMLERLTKNGIFAPIEINKICGDIAVVHSGSDNSDMAVENVIAEFGKPFNIFEGYNNGNSTLICVNGLDYPVSHVKQLGELAQQAFNERNRNRKSVEKLSNFDFLEDKVIQKVATQKQSTKLDALRKLMEK
jgi:cell division GTPase FtsZ